MTGKTLYPSLSRLWKRLRKLLRFLAFGSLLSTAYAGQLTLSWNESSDNEEGFKIERSVDGGSFQQIATVGVNVATYTDVTVEDNQSYAYRLKAFNRFGDSGYSNTASGVSRPTGAERTPVIVSQPENTVVLLGDTTALSIDVDATPAASVQWFVEGQAIPGATGAELLLTQVERSHAGSYYAIVTNRYGSVTSATARLTIDALIDVIQAPLDFAIDSEGTVTLSVSAEGPGLTYQWYRGNSGDKSNPIEGASNSVYETDKITQDTNYWVEIKTGGIAQGVEVYNGETIQVNLEQPSRFFFGEIGPGDQGSFAMMLREDGSAAFLANLSTLSTRLEVLDLVVDGQGAFQYQDEGQTGFSGNVSENSVSGVFTGTNLSFSGSKSVEDGVSKSISGLFTGVMPNTADGQVFVIAGPSGKSFVSISLGKEGESGFATISPSGVLTADLSTLYTIALSIDESYLSLDGMVLIGDKGYPVDGQSENVTSESQLINTSARGQVKGGSATMIVGFVVDGVGTKKVLVRGLGPSLSSRGVLDAVADPRISIFRRGEVDPIAENDDWGSVANASDIEICSQIVGASPLDINSADAALLVELSAGVYTAIIENGAAEAGTALLEVFDVSEAEGVEANTALANISMRGEVGRGDDVAIAGFVVTGDTPKKFLIRAMGTELEKSGVSNALGDPRLKIFQSTSEGSVLISENDDWHEEAEIALEASNRSGAFGFDEESKSSAKVIWLDPGLYTAVAESSDNSTGVVLVEVYGVR